MTNKKVDPAQLFSTNAMAKCHGIFKELENDTDEIDNRPSRISWACSRRRCSGKRRNFVDAAAIREGRSQSDHQV
jgi:hypothetical protein